MALPINMDDLINQRVVESTRIEFKGDWNPNPIIHSICAFANDIDNVGGGYLVIGIEEENGSLVKMQVFVGKISALLNPVTYVIINIATVAVIWVGATRVDAGIISQGKVIALVNYMAQILVELIKMANLIILISKAVACMKRVDSVFEIKSSIEEKPHEIKTQNTENEMETTQKISPETAKVEFDHVDFAYAGAKSDSLTDISFKAMKGQTIGVIGGTGSGKSTLVNLIPRFYDVREGKVLIDGADVRDLPLTELRHAIGAVPQRAVLFKGTLRDNMRWGKEDATDEEILPRQEILLKPRAKVLI